MSKVKIPKKMSNDESKLIADVVVKERKAAISMAEVYAARNRLKKFYEVKK